MMGASLRFTALVDNHAGGDLRTEHGLSLWIETGNERILFDTGQGAVLPGNARRLGIDLSQAGVLVLSHGHYDHTGGIAHVLECNSNIHVYAHPGILQDRYSIRDGNSPRTVQIPISSKTAVERIPPERMHWVMERLDLTPKISLSSPIPRVTEWEDTGGSFYLDLESKRPDPIEDDMALWTRTEKGLVVLTGCCHAGLVNTVRHALSESGESRLHAVMGGFHLVQASTERLKRTCLMLKEWNPDRLISLHCTGEDATRFLKDYFGEKVTQGYCGQTFVF